MAKAGPVLAGEEYDTFVNTIKSESTKQQYIRAIRHYMDFLKFDVMSDLLKGDAKLLQARVASYIMDHREKGLSTSVIQVRLAGIKHFYAMNDVVLNWDKIYSYVGQPTKKRKNRPYTRLEIAKVLSLCAPRDRMAVLLMASSGMRVGALTDLQVKHLQKIDSYRLYQITVYEGTPDEYVTFCTPECAATIDYWLDYRRKAGENITGESFLLREFFDARDSLQVNHPKKVKTNTIQFQVHQKLIQAGLREGHLLESETKGSKRHDVKMSHGFRKFFHTTATQAGVHNLYVDMLTGHKNGLKASYLIPTPKELLEGNDNIKGYIAAIKDLTIDDKERLELKVEDLQTQNEIIEGKYQRHYQRIVDYLIRHSQGGSNELNELLNMDGLLDSSGKGYISKEHRNALIRKYQVDEDALSQGR